MPDFRMTASFRRVDEALLTLEGAVGHAENQQVATILQALLDAGSRHVVVDVTAARPTGRELAAQLDDARKRLTARGGWLLVDPPGASGASGPGPASGAPDSPTPEDTTPDDTAPDDRAVDDDGQLAELFSIYRRVTTPARGTLRACGC